MSIDESEERFRINDDVCRNCGSRYRNGQAKLLPCLHTFCEQCLRTYAQLQDPVEQAGSLNRLVCPRCESSFSADEVITSPFVQSRSKPEVQCYEEPCSSICCTSCTQAASFCLECSDFLCSGCVDAHKRVKITRVHSLIDIGRDCQSREEELDGGVNTSILCQSHPFPAQLYCRDCESLICFKCRIQNHKEHHCNVVHKRNNLSADQKLKLNENLNILKSDIRNVKFDNLINMMDQKKKHINQQKDKLNKLMNHFNRCLTDLQTFMGGIFDDELNSISNKHGEIGKFRKRTEHTIDFFEQLMQTSDDISVLAVKSLVFRNIGALESELITTHRCGLEGCGCPAPVTTTGISHQHPPTRLHSPGNVTAHSSTRNSHQLLSADLDQVKQRVTVEDQSDPWHDRNGEMVDFIQGVETDPDPDESLQPMDNPTVSDRMRHSPMVQASASPAKSTATSQTMTVSDQGSRNRNRSREDTGPRTPHRNIPEAVSSPRLSARLDSLAIQDVRSVAGDWWEDGQSAPDLHTEATGPRVTAGSETLENGASCRKKTIQDQSKNRVTAYRDTHGREANYYLASHDPDDPWEDLCRVCQEGGDVVLCEWCPRVYHKHCYVPTMTQDPPSPWQCDLCQELEEISTGPSAAGDGNRRCKRKHSATLNAAELKVCERILLELYCVFEGIIFHKPVQAKKRDYYKMIKKPMAFSSIKTKLRQENSSHYGCIEDFLYDVNLVFSNCYKFNIDNPDIYEACEMTETLFKALVEKYLPQFSVNLD